MPAEAGTQDTTPHRCEPCRSVPEIEQLRLAGLVVAFLCLVTPASAEILIGVAAPMTGRYAKQGEAIRKGVEDDVSRANTSGGIKGQKLSVIAVDDGCDAKAGVEAARTLIERKVAIVVGHTCAGAALAASQVYAAANTVFFALNGHPDITDKRAGLTIFRPVGRDDRQGDAIAKHVLEHFHGQRIAIVHDRTRYARVIADRVRFVLGEYKMMPAMSEGLVAGEKDYRWLIEKLRTSKSSVIVFAGFPNEAAVLMKGMRAVDLDLQMIGSESLIGGLWLAAGPLAEGTRLAAAVRPEIFAHGLIEVLSDASELGPIEGVQLAQSLTVPSRGRLRGGFDSRGDSNSQSHDVMVLTAGQLKPMP